MPAMGCRTAINRQFILSVNLNRRQKGMFPQQKGRFDPAGTAQNNYSNLQGPQGRKSYGYQGPSFSSAANKSSGLANRMKGKVSNKPTEQGLGGFNKHHNRKVANNPRHPPIEET